MCSRFLPLLALPKNTFRPSRIAPKHVLGHSDHSFPQRTVRRTPRREAVAKSISQSSRSPPSASFQTLLEAASSLSSRTALYRRHTCKYRETFECLLWICTLRSEAGSRSGLSGRWDAVLYDAGLAAGPFCLQRRKLHERPLQSSPGPSLVQIEDTPRPGGLVPFLVKSLYRSLTSICLNQVTITTVNEVLHI